MLPDESGAIVIPNSNCFPGRNGNQPHYVILHGTAGGGSAVNVANYFASVQGGDNPVSSHYVIGTDGTVVQCVSEQDGAWANGVLTSGHDSWWNPQVNPNNITISIEHCNASTDNSNPLTEAQKAASFTLVQHICQRWNIPARPADENGGITGHFSIDPINRSRCPGNYPWEELWTVLKGEDEVLDLNDAIVRKYFKDGGNGTWKCVNGVTLLGANLTFYRSKGGPALFGLPLSNEVRLSQYPNTAIVPCERVIIVYDPDRKIDKPPIQGPCYLLHIDKGPGNQLLQQQTNSAVQALTDKLTQIYKLSTPPQQQTNSAAQALTDKLTQIHKLSTLP